MEVEELDLFFQLFIRALDNVAPAYFSTQYAMAKEIIAYAPQGQRPSLYQKRVGDMIVQTGERMFCYELYHQLRKLLEENSQTFQNVYLQGELQKIEILTIIQNYGLGRLTGNFIPDLLLHSPGTAEFHPYVIEVKADRFLSWEAVHADIAKIAQFMTAYRYQRGIFLTTTIAFDYLLNTRIMENPLLADIPNLNILAPHIYIVNRENEAQPARSVVLSEIWPLNRS